MDKEKIIKKFRNLQQKEEGTPQRYDEKNFIEDECSYLDGFNYKGIDVAFYRNSGQTNVWYEWIIHFEDGDEEIVDSGNFASDVRNIIKIIDKKGEKMNKKEAKLKIERLEQKAKDRYIENSDWDSVLNMLDDGEKKELNKAYRRLWL